MCPVHDLGTATDIDVYGNFQVLMIALAVGMPPEVIYLTKPVTLFDTC